MAIRTPFPSPSANARLASSISIQGIRRRIFIRIQTLTA
jgi:hypothetical protein